MKRWWCAGKVLGATRLLFAFFVTVIAAALTAGSVVSASVAATAARVQSLPGSVIAWEAMEGEGALSECFAVLVEVDEEATRLGLYCPQLEQEAWRVLADLPAEVAGLSARATGDGAEIWLGSPGVIDKVSISTAGEVLKKTRVLEDDSLGPRAFTWVCLEGESCEPEARVLLQATHFGLSVWSMHPEPKKTWALNLPPIAILRRFGPEVEIRGRTIRAAGNASRVYWTRPVSFPGARLRTYRIALDEKEHCRQWIHTDKPVAVVGNAYAALDGDDPILLALVRPREGTSLLGEMELLTAPLVCDETGRGRPAVELRKTRHPLGFLARVLGPFDDLTGDGVPDMVILGTTGRLKPKAFLSVIPLAGNRPVGRLRTWSYRLTSFVNYDPLFKDVDRDGRPDLVFAHGEELLVFYGQSPDERGVPLPRKPDASFRLPAGFKSTRTLLVQGRHLLLTGRIDRDEGEDVLVAFPKVFRRGE